jgi:hypothetical protein
VPGEGAPTHATALDARSARTKVARAADTVSVVKEPMMLRIDDLDQVEKLD